MLACGQGFVSAWRNTQVLAEPNFGLLDAAANISVLAGITRILINNIRQQLSRQTVLVLEKRSNFKIISEAKNKVYMGVMP